MTLNEHSSAGRGRRRGTHTHIRQGFPDAKCRPAVRRVGRGVRSDTRRDSSGLKMKINNAICHVASLLLAQPEQQKRK